MTLGEIDELRREVAELRAIVAVLAPDLPRLGPCVTIHEDARVDPSCILKTGPNSNRISIGRHSQILRNAEWIGPVTVGERVFINRDSFMRPNVTIGNDVSIGQFVKLITDSHEISAGSRRTGTPSHNPIRIGDGTWVGAGAMVLGGVTIGSRSIIAAGAVVTRDIPDNAVAAGIPAKVIRYIDDVDGVATLRPTQ